MNNPYLYKGEITFAPHPQPVGYWILYPGAPMKTMFAMYRKPTDEQIKNTEQLLGWEWKDHGANP